MESSRSLIIVLIGLLFISTVNSQSVYKKVIHNTDPEAKCLDGSPASFYIHEGTVKDKFMLYFNGGGFCGMQTLSDTLQSCYQRSKTDLGSSKPLPDTLSNAEGILALDSSQNLYGNWTKVFINYCDGSLHQGDNESPVPYKDTKLYFRGSRIVRSHFKYLISKYKLDQASKIIITGGSAGAVASYLWGNYLLSLVKNPSVVYNIPDSGIFINENAYKYDVPLIQMAVVNLMKLAHVSEQTPLEDCNKQYPGEEWKCIFAEVNYPYLKGKYLFLNSEYDQWGISNILQIKCLKGGSSGYTLKYCSTDEIKAIEGYRSKYLDVINKIRTKQRGIWTISCSKHTYAPYKDFYDVDVQRVPQKTGSNVKQAIQSFVFEDKINWTVDPSAWPSNGPCAY